MKHFNRNREKIDIVEHKKKLQHCVGPEFEHSRPEHHTADEHSKDILEVRRKTRAEDGPQIAT